MMKLKKFYCLLAFMMTLGSTPALHASFSDWFVDRTLRLDFIFSGNNKEQKISLDEMSSMKGWAGRRLHLDSLILEGNGQILMMDSESGKVVYEQSFSTLFQEWQLTPEAKQRVRSFENCFLLPMPCKRVNVQVRLQNSRREITACETFPVEPNDILIRDLDVVPPLPYRYIYRGGNAEECIDVAFVAEGYKENQMKNFYKDVKDMADELFRHEPFKTYKTCFNIVAVASPSVDNGVSVPHDGMWKNTAVGSHFDTFYTTRYLTSLHQKKLHDVLAGIPYEHIVVLANSEVYGGGGIYNLYMMTTAHHKWSKPVCVHEFGHSFAGLADEYNSPTEGDAYYCSGIEPWEKNITTLADFSVKWKDMLPQGTSVPTLEIPDKHDYETLGVYEGAGYQNKGVFRPTQTCRMRENAVPAFCPVCQRAIKEMIGFYLGK